METTELFGFKFISSKTYDCLLNDIFFEKKFNLEKAPCLITPNVDQIVKFSKNKKLADFFKNSRYVLPDGLPIVWLSHIIGPKLKSRLTGSDFFPVIWRKCIDLNKPVLCIVPDKKIGELLSGENNKAFFYSPPYFDISDTITLHAIVNDIKHIIEDKKPDFIFLGLGYPKQETLTLMLIDQMDNNRQPTPLFLLLGASFEFYLKIKKRAPKIVQKMGLEWLYRLLQEPQRLWKRYLTSNTLFLFLVFKEFYVKKIKSVFTLPGN